MRFELLVHVPLHTQTWCFPTTSICISVSTSALADQYSDFTCLPIMMKFCARI